MYITDKGLLCRISKNSYKAIRKENFLLEKYTKDGANNSIKEENGRDRKI